MEGSEGVGGDRDGTHNPHEEPIYRGEEMSSCILRSYLQSS